MLEWYVYKYDINNNSIYTYNVFDHYRFEEEVLETLHKDLTYDKFSERLRSIAMYFFWCKAEHEIVVTSFPPYINAKEAKRISKENVKYRTHVALDCGIKVDIYSQLQLNWDAFVNYVWNAKNKGM